MRIVGFHPEARAEFLHEVEYFVAISARLAEYHDEAVRAAEEQAAEAPESWPKYMHKTRQAVDRRIKFSLVYQHGENEIRVVDIAPAERKPGYWKAGFSAA